MTQVDVIIVGAGAAGLGAAMRCKELGLKVAHLEAADRLGGRAFTRFEPFGFAWDAGCHWLHSASINPFTRFADELGFSYRTDRSPWGYWRKGEAASAAEMAVMDDAYAAAYERILQAGRAGSDLPMTDFLNTPDPAYPLFHLGICAEWGVAPSAASTLDAARYRDTNENWPVVDGYGALLLRVAADVVRDVALNTPVSEITYDPSGVRVTTPNGTIDAGAVIVTVSTNVLADDVIRFSPVLPGWKLEALAAVPLGSDNKVALQLEPNVLKDVPEQGMAVILPGGDGMSLRFRPYGRDLVDGYIGGPFSAELEAAGEAEMIAVTTDALVSVLGSDARAGVKATAVSRWGVEPYIRGSYAAAIPGKAHLREQLALPVEDRIFFAGEATAQDFFTTCHGAWQSGVCAADAAAKARDKAAI